MTAWEKTKRAGKAGWDAAWDKFEKLGQPVNRFTNKIGSEAFWPTSLDRESDKAARILKSFCSKYIYLEYSAMLTSIFQRTVSTRKGINRLTTMAPSRRPKSSSRYPQALSKTVPA
jgi:hypothetical protein